MVDHDSLWQPAIADQLYHNNECQYAILAQGLGLQILKLSNREDNYINKVTNILKYLRQTLSKPGLHNHTH